MNLSPHFTLAELTRTGTGLPNDPSPAQIEKLRALCVHILEPVRAHFNRPVKVNSGYRSPAVNAAVGSKPTSDHCKGCAADIEIDGVSNYELAKWVRDHLQFKQLILEAYKPGIPSSGWVHIAYIDGNNSKSVLTMSMSSHGPTYENGLRA